MSTVDRRPLVLRKEFSDALYAVLVEGYGV